MGRSSFSRWAALAVAIGACVLTTPSALAARAAADPSPTPTEAPTATPTPAPTPAPTPTPTAAPSTPTPAPSGTPAPAPSVSATATATPVPSSAPTPTPSSTPSPVPTRTALPAPGAAVAVLSSDTIQITSLRSLAVRTVSTAAGPVKVIELQADGSTITGLGLQGPCVSHARVDTNATRDVASGGLTLDATALQATILGVSIIVAAADLPEGAVTLPGITLPPLPTDLGIATVKLQVQSIRSGAMTLDAPRITTSPC